MSNKQTARELLKESLDRLSEVAMLYQNKSDIDLAKRIDTYLAASNESAMEMVRKIRGNDDEIGFFHLTDSEAAALIEDYGRRVPRAMLNEIIRYTEGMVEWDGEVSDYEFVDKIAAKHGVEPF